MSDLNIPRARDISLTAPVTVTLPAHVWAGFLASYMSTEWVCFYTTTVATAVQEQIMDPLWLKEQDAKRDDDMSQPPAFIARLLGGAPPDLPPNMTDTP